MFKFRFSLRGLLVAVFICAAMISLYLNTIAPRVRQGVAYRKISEDAARIGFEKDADLSTWQRFLCLFLKPEEARPVVEVTVTGNSPCPLSNFNEFTSLRKLVLTADGELEEGNEDFGPFLKLEELYIQNGNPKDISSMHCLSNLKLFSCYRKIEKGMGVLGTLPKLRVVDLLGSEFSQEDLDGLSRSRSIEEVRIRFDSKVNSIDRFCEMKQLKSVTILQNNVELSQLLSLSSLQKVELSRSTDRDEPVLAELRKRGVQVNVLDP